MQKEGGIRNLEFVVFVSREKRHERAEKNGDREIKSVKEKAYYMQNREAVRYPTNQATSLQPQTQHCFSLYTYHLLSLSFSLFCAFFYLSLYRCW